MPDRLRRGIPAAGLLAVSLLAGEFSATAEEAVPVPLPPDATADGQPIPEPNRDVLGGLRRRSSAQRWSESPAPEKRVERPRRAVPFVPARPATTSLPTWKTAEAPQSVSEERAVPTPPVIEQAEDIPTGRSLISRGEPGTAAVSRVSQVDPAVPAQPPMPGRDLFANEKNGNETAAYSPTTLRRISDILPYGDYEPDPRTAASDPCRHLCSRPGGCANPDPGTMAGYAGQVGKKYYFRVTGNKGGPVYGNKVYSANSTIAAAAVHAGVLKPGETGDVEVTVIAGLDGYQSDSANGIETKEAGASDTAYRLTIVCPPEHWETAEYLPRFFEPSCFTWAASNLWYNPLYFEDVALERYGHTFCEPIQPFVSVGKFGAQLVTLPYHMGIDPPCKKEYALGYYRPGECAPKLCYQPPLSARGGLAQAGVMTGLFFVIP